MPKFLASTNIQTMKMAFGLGIRGRVSEKRVQQDRLQEPVFMDSDTYPASLVASFHEDKTDADSFQRLSPRSAA